MQTLSSAEEQKLLTGVKEAVDLVDNQGMSPDDALTKVARDHGWSKGGLRSAVNAFNNGRQVAQWRANESVLDKLAEFPLADYDVIVKRIWGGTQKEAKDHFYGPQGIDPAYGLPPGWSNVPDRAKLLAMPLPNGLEKAAGEGGVPDRESDPDVAEHRQKRAMFLAWNAHQGANRTFEEARTKYAQAHDLVRVQLRLLENYFKKAAMDRLPFSVVEDASTAYYGARGRALFDLLAKSFPKEKRAADSRIFYDRPLNRQAAPFPFVAKAIAAAKEVYRAKQAMDEAFGRLEKAAEDLRPFAVAPRRHEDDLSPNLLSATEKSAGVGTLMAAGTAGAVGSAARGLVDKALSGYETDKAVAKAWMDLEDPEHENELRKIRVQAMLNSMMSDTENPISAYDPDDVLQAYNELAQLAPRLSEQPAAVAPLLHKRLAGQMQPFEVAEALGIEKGLKDSKVTTPKTRSLLDAPDSLLG